MYVYLYVSRVLHEVGGPEVDVRLVLPHQAEHEEAGGLQADRDQSDLRDTSCVFYEKDGLHIGWKNKV